MKRLVCWNLFIRDTVSDNTVCAKTMHDEDKDKFLEQFITMTDLGINCYVQVDIWYMREEEEE